MTHIIEIGSTRIGLREIDPYNSLGRRDAERRAVAAILRDLLGHDAEITHTPDGAPAIPNYNISISHSRSLATVALDPIRPIGIDVEEPRHTLEKVRDRFITPAELARIATMDNPLLFAWTAKEAVYKADPTAGPDFIRDIQILSPSAARTIARTFDLTTIHLRPSLLTLAYPATSPSSL